MEEETRNALRSFFRFKIHSLERELRKFNIRILNHLFFGFLLLWAGNTYPGHDFSRDWVIVLTEDIFIGG